MTVAQKAELEQIAAKNDLSLARVLQQAIREFLVNHRDHRFELHLGSEPSE
jgi:hypothetical protein